jgi:microcystin-dependent protein
MKNKYYLILIFFLFVKSVFAQDQFVGEIRLFTCNFAPKGWAKCEGQLLPISQNTALFSILGTTYGGDGKTTFALPDLRDRMAIGFGQGPGLSYVVLGQTDGNATLAPNNLPAHTHFVDIKVSSGTGTSSVPSASTSLAAPVQIFNSASRPVTEYIVASPDITLPNITTSTTGSSTPVSTQPSLASTYCIALQGIFPPRN